MVMNNTKKEDVVEKLKKFNEKKTGEPLVIPVERVHYRGFLPHYDFGGLYQMITYRLNDSLPKNITRESKVLTCYFGSFWAFGLFFAF